MFIRIIPHLCSRLQKYVDDEYGTERTRADFFRDSTIAGKDTIRVIISRVAFEKSRHKIDSSKTEFGIAVRGRGDSGDTTYLVGKIDGRDIYGRFLELPRYEIGQFDVSWNGHPVIVPKRLYSDCYEPNFDRGDAPEFIRIVASDNGKEILIEMDGGDAGGAYTVWWIIARNGKHSRFIEWSDFR